MHHSFLVMPAKPAVLKRLRVCIETQQSVEGLETRIPPLWNALRVKPSPANPIAVFRSHSTAHAEIDSVIDNRGPFHDVTTRSGVNATMFLKKSVKLPSVRKLSVRLELNANNRLNGSGPYSIDSLHVSVNREVSVRYRKRTSVTSRRKLRVISDPLPDCRLVSITTPSGRVLPTWISQQTPPRFARWLELGLLRQSRTPPISAQVRCKLPASYRHRKTDQRQIHQHPSDAQ